MYNEAYIICELQKRLDVDFEGGAGVGEVKGGQHVRMDYAYLSDCFATQQYLAAAAGEVCRV